jgi:hypothetical protein
MKNLIRRVLVRYRRALDRIVIRYARTRGWVISSETQLDLVLMYLRGEYDRLTRQGGGSASRLRRPRHTLKRTVRRLHDNLAALRRGKSDA